MTFSQKYPLVTEDVVLNKLVSSSALKQANMDIACFQKLAVENQLNIVQGRAIYPRYYQADDGKTFTDSVGYKSVAEGSLVFQMVGQINGRFVFPMSEPPDFFPNTSDLTLFIIKKGCCGLFMWGKTIMEVFYFGFFLSLKVSINSWHYLLTLLSDEALASSAFVEL